MSIRDSVSHAINHPIRKRVIGAPWHSSEPLSAECIRGEYLDGDKFSLTLISYYVQVLEQDGIVKLHPEEATEGRQTTRSLSSRVRGVERRSGACSPQAVDHHR